MVSGTARRPTITKRITVSILARFHHLSRVEFAVGVQSTWAWMLDARLLFPTCNVCVANSWFLGTYSRAHVHNHAGVARL